MSLSVITDINAIRYNINSIKVNFNSKICLMVKADAYGHGIKEVAKSVENIIDYFGVATVNEGVALRENGIKIPILVSYFESNDTDTIAFYNLTVAISDTNDIERLNKSAERFKNKIKIHIKINTGMNRLGVADLITFNDLVGRVKSTKSLILDGIYTHFYSTDYEVCRAQYEKFKLYLDNLKKIRDNLIIHCCSSYAALNYSEFREDMVRIGLAAYGYGDYYGLKLIKTMTVKSKIIGIQHLMGNDGAGYSHLYKTSQKTDIAIVNGGYYDGILRNYIGHNVIVNGEYCPIVAVCMDMFLIDLGGIKAQKGDEVIIIGECGDKAVTADDIAKVSKTISYEILTNFKGRIEREFYL